MADRTQCPICGTWVKAHGEGRETPRMVAGPSMPLSQDPEIVRRRARASALRANNAARAAA